VPKELSNLLRTLSHAMNTPITSDSSETVNVARQSQASRRTTHPVLVTFIALALVLVAVKSTAKPWSSLISPDNSLEFRFLNDDAVVFRLGLAGWGPNWQWVDVSSKGTAAGDKLAITTPFVVNRANGEVIDIKFQAWKSGKREMKLRYELTAVKDVPVTAVIVGLAVEDGFAKGQWTLTHPDGKKSTLKLPVGITSQPATSKVVLSLSNVGDVSITLDPPCGIDFDKDLRVLLAQNAFKAGSRATTLTITFPDQVAFLAKQADLDRLTRNVARPDWFSFTPSDDLGPSVIGMEDWLEKPAGKRGFVRGEGDRFQFADGTPVKFWGVNLSYSAGCAPDKKDAEFTAARYAKYGINAVRLHKFSYPTDQMGIADRNDSTHMTPDGLERLDYFSAKLRQRGIYYAWSHTFGFQVTPGQRARLLAYDEIEKNLKGNTYGLINLAEDVQDLMIEMVVGLLRHLNPHTGLNYANDPALAYIELQNEDDIFFFTNENAFKACPTYTKHFVARFGDWLRAKYGSEENLRKAWGDALRPGESLAAKNLVPQTNPWFFGEDNLPKQTVGARKRLLDTAQHFHELQNKFYSRFAKAIRDAGYKGALCGSPWQAPAQLPHYLNLRSDALVGFIDRHNYFGGGLFDTMLSKPGSGYFSSGLQQVTDRPFGLSEWIHVYPSLYSAEGPAIIAAYGLGLQGWDASFEFQSQVHHHTFNDRVGWPPWGVWEGDVPTQLGQYPALARMIYRGDVKEGEVISIRRVSREDLATGKFNFSDKMQQQGDIKSFGGSVPAEALAAGRVVIEFTDTSQSSTLPDMTKYRQDSVIVSSTKQLAWNTGDKGFFTINTPGTKAVVGFAIGKPQRLGDVSIELQCPFASVILTALDRNATLANTKSALLCAVARNSNSGFKYFALDGKTLDNGTAPILLEPIKATVIVAGRPLAAVNVLDHSGRRTGKTLRVTMGRIAIDGTRDHAMYYEVVFR